MVRWVPLACLGAVCWYGGWKFWVSSGATSGLLVFSSTSLSSVTGAILVDIVGVFGEFKGRDACLWVSPPWSSDLVYGIVHRFLPQLVRNWVVSMGIVHRYFMLMDGVWPRSDLTSVVERSKGL